MVLFTKLRVVGAAATVTVNDDGIVSDNDKKYVSFSYSILFENYKNLICLEKYSTS